MMYQADPVPNAPHMPTPLPTTDLDVCQGVQEVERNRAAGCGRGRRLPGRAIREEELLHHLIQRSLWVGVKVHWARSKSCVSCACEGEVMGRLEWHRDARARVYGVA